MMVSDYLWWYVCSRCLGDVIEIYGDVNRFLGSCYELLRQKWQDSLRSPDELRADLWSSKRDSGHDPKKWADRLIFRDRVKLWSQWQQSGWISWASQSDLPWLTVHWNDMNRRLLWKFTLGSCKPWVLVDVGCFYIFHPNLHHLAS